MRLPFSPSAGPVNARRQVPPYLPISCTRLEDHQLVGSSRFSPGGNLPALHQVRQHRSLLECLRHRGWVQDDGCAFELANQRAEISFAAAGAAGQAARRQLLLELRQRRRRRSGRGRCPGRWWRRRWFWLQCGVGAALGDIVSATVTWACCTRPVPKRRTAPRPAVGSVRREIVGFADIKSPSSGLLKTAWAGLTHPSIEVPRLRWQRTKWLVRFPPHAGLTVIFDSTAYWHRG